MKQYLTPEQTANLIELGFEKPNMALVKAESLCQSGTDLVWRTTNYEQNYSIGELLSFLPENIATRDEMPSTLNISLLDSEWCVEYADFLGADFSFRNVELIDAAFNMIVKLKEWGVI